MSALALAALLAASALGAEPDDWNELHEVFCAQTLDILRRLSSTKELHAFVLERRVDLQVVGPDTPGSPLQDSNLGLYDPQKRVMFLNRARLIEGAGQLEDAGFTEDEAAVVLAWRAAPLVAHEIRHALTDQEIRAAAGAAYPLTSREEEVVAYFDTVRVIQEGREAMPPFWKPGLLPYFDEQWAPVLEAWRHGPAGLDKLVESLRVEATILGWSREKLLHWCREALRARRSIKDSELPAGTPVLTQDPDSEDPWAVRFAPPKEGGLRARIRRSLRDFEQAEAFLEVPGNWEKLRAVYRRRMRAVERAGRGAR